MLQKVSFTVQCLETMHVDGSTGGRIVSGLDAKDGLLAILHRATHNFSDLRKMELVQKPPTCIASHPFNQL